jgi:CMP-N-acetylneuraminic acid synthetase
MTALPSAWALVPARGGSKSIPRKNLVEIGGVPMLDFGVRAAQAAGVFARIICSTDDAEIERRARMLGIEHDRRPDELATDAAAVSDVARDFLVRQRAQGQPLPDVVVLVQPTSPFLRSQDCSALLQAMADDPACRSAQTVCLPPHNHHALNQRVLVGGRASFRFGEERRKAYNKQLKPMLYIFGNLVAARSAVLLDGADFFADPSAAVAIERPYDIDVDTMIDVDIARALLESGQVQLPHVSQPAPRVAP